MTTPAKPPRRPPRPRKQRVHARRGADLRHSVPQARARRHPRLYRRRRGHRAVCARPDRRPRAADAGVRNRHRVPAVPRRARAQSEPAVAAAQGHFRAGLAQVVLCGLALSVFIYFALGFTLEAALAIGLPLALSSTAQVLPMLRSDSELNTPQGERTFSILLFQDLSIVPMITIIAALSRVAARPERAAAAGRSRCTRSGGSLGAGARRPLHPQSVVPPGRAASASANCSSSPACSR